ncbi:hypothetical protein CRI87_10795 [Liquorilactobacillus satsumensis]|nr:hypothetical protein [Liquorilactobacillus satsumensis]
MSLMVKEYVVGMGDNVVDYYNNQNVKFPGGNAVNFSVFAPKTLVNSFYVGSLARDDDGDLILESLKQEDVNTQFCNRIDGQTEKTFVNIVNGDRKFLDSVRGKRALPSLEDPKLLRLAREALLVYSSCHSNSEKAIGKLHTNGSTIAYDFSEMGKYHSDEYLENVAKNVDIAQFSLSDSPVGDKERILETCTKVGTKFVLFTNGGEPPELFDCRNDRKFVGQINYDPHPVDTMGAGDAFFSNLVVFMLSNEKELLEISDQKINDALSFAAKAASRTIRRSGSYGYGKKIK